MPDSQQLTSNPRFVALHDGAGKAFLTLVSKEDDALHIWGAGWCDDEDNALGWSAGSWNAVREAGQLPDVDGLPQAYSWSELKED